MYIFRNNLNINRKEQRDSFAFLKHVTPRDIRIYRKREKLEKEYKDKCGKLLQLIKEERQNRWNQIDIKRRGGVKTVAQVMNERQLKKFSKSSGKRMNLNKMLQGNAHNGQLQRCQSEQLKRGFHSIIQNPKKYFKDVLGEKKSIFAKDLVQVKRLLKSNQKFLHRKRQTQLVTQESITNRFARFYSPRTR